MTSNEYSKALDKALADLESRVQQRDILNAEIAGLRETVRVLSSRTAMAADKQQQVAQLLDMVDYLTPSLTDSIRAVLARSFPLGKTAVQVRNTLEESGFNFDDFSNSLSACHAALKRMLNDGEAEIAETVEGKPSYRRILKMTPPPKVRLPWEPIYESGMRGDEKPKTLSHPYKPGTIADVRKKE